MAFKASLNYIIFCLDNGVHLSVHEVIDDLCQVKIVKLRYEEAEFLVRTELKGKAYLAFKAVGIRVPPRVIELNVVPTSSFTLKNAHKQ